MPELLQPLEEKEAIEAQLWTPNALIVDDNPFNLHILEHVLVQKNCKVTKALNG